MTCRKPVLIVEGPGDEEAVPRLLREYCFAQGVYDFTTSPHTIKNAEIRKLRRENILEKYIEYAIRNDGDSVLIVLDCEDFNPNLIISEFRNRVNIMQPRKPVEIILFKAEFESLYLFCLEAIAARFPEYDWNPNKLSITGDCERFRNAKGCISEAMREKAYKETRDQAKFLTAINFDRLRETSASFRRFEETIKRFIE